MSSTSVRIEIFSAVEMGGVTGAGMVAAMEVVVTVGVGVAAPGKAGKLAEAELGGGGAIATGAAGGG